MLPVGDETRVDAAPVPSRPELARTSLFDARTSRAARFAFRSLPTIASVLAPARDASGCTGEARANSFFSIGRLPHLELHEKQLTEELVVVAGSPAVYCSPSETFEGPGLPKIQPPALRVQGGHAGRERQASDRRQ